MRFSTIPGDILDDSVSAPRGLAIKIIGVEEAQAQIDSPAPRQRRVRERTGKKENENGKS
jgi:hypothetical protein